MKKRQAKKIVKKYGDSWWKIVSATDCVLDPPRKWSIKKIMGSFHAFAQFRARGTFPNGYYSYSIPKSFVEWAEKEEGRITSGGGRNEGENGKDKRSLHILATTKEGER